MEGGYRYMNTAYLNLMQDKHIRRFFIFLLTFCIALLTMAAAFCIAVTASAKNMLLSHDTAVASSLISQGVSENIIAKALTTELPIAQDTVYVQEGSDLLSRLGLVPSLETRFLPHLHTFAIRTGYRALAILLLACFLLLGVSLLFLHKRDRLYYQAISIIDRYIDGDYSIRLPQEDEGCIYQMFSCTDRLATMLQAQNESEQKSKLFLRNTISDISHQLKTPLAALSMYQEIMANEPDQPDVIEKFALKAGLAIDRMEQLIHSLLKITRLDAGTIVFERQTCNLSTFISHATDELTTRAVNEGKSIIFDGCDTDTLLCDPSWTSEAVSNIVKNALDHTDCGGIVRICWDCSPIATRIMISDNGSGIAPEDIYHIFKRFYRSNSSPDTQGIGLGLPLAKSIVEGQGGTISVRSTPHEGTTFTLLFPT